MVAARHSLGPSAVVERGKAGRRFYRGSRRSVPVGGVVVVMVVGGVFGIVVTVVIGIIINLFDAAGLV